MRYSPKATTWNTNRNRNCEISRFLWFIFLCQFSDAFVTSVLILQRWTKVTQANSVSAGINCFSYDSGWSHDQCSYKDPDDGSSVCRRGCLRKTTTTTKKHTRQQEKVMKQKKGGAAGLSAFHTCNDWLIVWVSWFIHVQQKNKYNTFCFCSIKRDCECTQKGLFILCLYILYLSNFVHKFVKKPW